MEQIVNSFLKQHGIEHIDSFDKENNVWIYIKDGEVHFCKSDLTPINKETIGLGNDLIMLRMIGFGENLGSGFPKIIAAWKETNWGEPDLKNKIELDEVELILPVSTPKPANETVNATVNATVKLSKTQKRIFSILHENKYATYDEMAKQLGIERTTVWRNVDTMKKNAVIKRVGGDKNGYWEVLLDIIGLNNGGR